MTTMEHEELLTFAKVTERLRQIPFTPLDDQQTHRWVNDNYNNPDPAIQARLEWWDMKQHVHCALCDLNDELERDINSVSREIVSVLWDCGEYFGCDLNARH